MHTLPPERCAGERWEWEFDLQATVDELLAVLPDARVVPVRGEPREMIDAIERVRPDVVFNLCEAPLCDPGLESHAAALFEWMRVPFTGSPAAALELCRRKDRAKAILEAAGVPVPPSDVLPCIVKPVDEDGSVGIRGDSVCETAAERDRAIARLNGRALVEEFLPGREFVVSLWGRSAPEYAVIGEIGYTGGVRFITYEGKWDMESHVYVNAPFVFRADLEPALSSRLSAIAQQAWRATGIRGYATVDLRLDGDGTPCVIDVNPNAALNAEGRLRRAVEHHGWTWERFVRQQLTWALEPREP